MAQGKDDHREGDLLTRYAQLDLTPVKLTLLAGLVVLLDEHIDYAIRSGAPLEVLENLQEIEDEGDVYDSIEDIWPDYPTKEDFLFNDDEY